VVPVAAGDPTARAELLRLLCDPARELLLCAGAAQVDREQLEAAVDEMRVVVDEAGKRQFASEIDDSRVA
jgi:hypothetical protein